MVEEEEEGLWASLSFEWAWAWAWERMLWAWSLRERLRAWEERVGWVVVSSGAVWERVGLLLVVGGGGCGGAWRW